MTEVTEGPAAARSARRPTRADARRNYDALLVAADAAFTEDSVDTSLEEIARRAGVAIGTLYRHFPTREALIEAVLRDELDALRDRAERLLDHPDPEAAFISWIDALVDHASTYRGLSRQILAAFEDETSTLYRTHAQMQEVAERLLARAQEAGRIRHDIRLTHALTLTCALATAVEQGPDEPGYAAQLRRVLYDGLRTA